MDCSDIELALSAEHTAFEWAEYDRAYDRAYDLLRWQSDKIALGELRERLRRGILPTPE